MHFVGLGLTFLLLGCVKVATSQCNPALEFRCMDGQCISSSWRCDGRPDCRDSSDEQNCACSFSQFNCNNMVPAECISGLGRCDGKQDCTNGADEMNCLCQADQFQCVGGTRECVPLTWRCDGFADCRDGSDEGIAQGCVPTTPEPRTCLPRERACTSDMRCIPSEWFCDGQVDCADQSDENVSICPSTPVVTSCPSPRRLCSDRSQCFPQTFFCDGEVDCRDRSDEMGCNTTTTPPPTMTPLPNCTSGNLNNCTGPPLRIMLSTGNEIRLIGLSDNSSSGTLITGATQIVPLAYVNNDGGNSRVYYTDETATETRFLSSTLDFRNRVPTAAEPKVFLSDGIVGAPQGFAVDWISNVLYWTSYGAAGSAGSNNRAATIQVANFDGSYHQIVYRMAANTRPGHIAVDASRGLLFWAERFPTPRIMRCNVLGNDVLQVSPQDSAILGVPTGIAIDTANQVLYVTDRSNGNIERLSYDGATRTLLYRDKIEGIRSLAFFAGILYGTQFDRSSSEGKLLRFQVQNVNPSFDTLRSDLRSPQDLRVVYDGAQANNPGNPCSDNNGDCEALCLSVQNEAVCSCDGVAGRPFLAADRRTCVSAPTVTLSEDGETSIAEGSDLLLTCSVARTPYLSVLSLRWLRGGRALDPTTYTEVSGQTKYTSTLTASNLANSNSGMYHCQLTYVFNNGTTPVTSASSSTQSSEPLTVNVTPVAGSSNKTTAIVIGVVVGIIVIAIIVAIVIIVIRKMRTNGGTTIVYGNRGEDHVTIMKTNSDASGMGNNGTSI